MARLNPYPRAVDGAERTYEIHEVAHLTGLAPARLRAWERRYAVVRPKRLPNGYRAYTAEQVALLRAFARLIEHGHRIGDLASRPIEEVLAKAEGRTRDGSVHGELVEAVTRFDRERLEQLVAQQLSLRGTVGFAQEVVLPLAQEVGDLWALGKLPIAAEHLASEVVLHALKGALRLNRGQGPLCVAGCLPRERHEWGFLCVLADIQQMGWRIHYLGPDLPVDEVVEAAWKLGAEAVALTVSETVGIGAELPALLQLPARLPPRTFAVIGGGGTTPHERALRQAGFEVGLEAFARAADGGRQQDAAS